MTLTLFILYLALVATLMRAVLVKARVASARCAQCGLPFERKELGESVCRCGR